MALTVAVDAEAAVRDWCRTLGMNASLQSQRSGPDYLLLSRAGGVQQSAGIDQPTVSALAHAKTKQAAANLAGAFANAVWNLTTVQMTTGVWCTNADVDSGPSEVQDPSGTSRYLVVATFYLVASPQ